MGKKNLKMEAQERLDTFGIYITMSDPTIVEIAAYAGFDFVRIDCEHYLYSAETLTGMIGMANALGLAVHVRVGSVNEITRVLEAGADGIIVPHINTKEAAEEAVSAVKFAPLGERSMYNGYRCMHYGKIKASDYLASANDHVLLTVQIEDQEALRNIDDILSINGIDMVSSGKADLSQSLGYVGESNHPDVLRAEEYIAKKALMHGIYPSFLVSSKNRVSFLRNIGVHSFTVARDRKLLIDGMNRTTEIYRSETV